MFTINIWGILIGLVISFVLGFIWYGPLFGKLWGKIIGIDIDDPKKKAEMRGGMMVLYGVQAVLTTVSLIVLSLFVPSLTNWLGGIFIGVLVWAGFVMPTVGGFAIWSGKPKKLAWQLFLVSSGYNLVLYILFGLTFGLF